MFLKKSLLVGSIALLPFVAHALVINNYTDQYSTVRVTSGTIKPCSAVNPQYGITQPQEKNHTVPPDLVTKLCLTSAGGRCEADIYMTPNCNASGPAVAHAVLDIKSGNIISLTNYAGSGYAHTASGPVVNLQKSK